MDSPEAQPGFDDVLGQGRPARVGGPDLDQPERGQPTLAMSDYGFHHGDVWYRGRVDIVDPAANQLELFYGAGGAGMIQVWIDGRFVGQHELDVGRSFPETTDSVKLRCAGGAGGLGRVRTRLRSWCATTRTTGT
jgi:hypothetical protein